MNENKTKQNKYTYDAYLHIYKNKCLVWYIEMLHTIVNTCKRNNI